MRPPAMSSLAEFNKPVVNKGQLSTGHLLLLWDAVSSCAGELCRVYDDCPYAKGGPCTVEKKYIRTILDCFISGIDENKMTQLMLNKITLLLMPLYHQLIILKKEAYGITSRQVVYETASGQRKVDPIFKEIRECITAIGHVCVNLGMTHEYARAMGFMDSGKLFDDGFSEDEEEGRKKKKAEPYGDPSYYEKLFDDNMIKDVLPDGPKKRVKISRPLMGLDEDERRDEE